MMFFFPKTAQPDGNDFVVSMVADNVPHSADWYQRLHQKTALLKRDRLSILIAINHIYFRNVFTCTYYHRIMSTLSM
jgi:hypothetical protein